MKQVQILSITILASLFFLAGCTTADSEDPMTESECGSNSVTYQINGGMDCRDTPTVASVYTLNNTGANTEVTFNYVPPHNTLGNVTPRERTFSFTNTPAVANSVTQVANTSFTGNSGYIAYIFGIANTGVPFDPVANEPWVNTNDGSSNYEWNLEVLSSEAGLVYDCNNAHDPSRYHYHGTPFEYIRSLPAEDGSTHSGLMGYAADGFPIYYKYGYADPDDENSSIVALTSSFSVREACRLGDGKSAPDGEYDGSYVADYEFIDGQGDLDECNGRMSITPEYPNGTYAYYVTDEFPSIPRCFKGTPSDDYKINIGQ